MVEAFGWRKALAIKHCERDETGDDKEGEKYHVEDCFLMVLFVFLGLFVFSFV